MADYRNDDKHRDRPVWNRAVTPTLCDELVFGACLRSGRHILLAFDNRTIPSNHLSVVLSPKTSAQPISLAIISRTR